MTAHDLDTEASTARAQLTQSLADAGVITDPAWRAAFREVPRHLFVPAFYDHTGRLIRGDDPGTAAEWFAAVHDDRPLVTRRTDGVATSSSTEPSLMAEMLHALDVEDGMRVLEIGTGTGYNAGLLAHRLGGAQVVTVDLSPDITGPARAHLAAAGLSPFVVTGDGVDGWPSGAPYDRIIATCRLHAIPLPLLQQLTADGLLLAPLGGALALLRRTGSDAAEGRFLSRAFFMAMRRGGADTGVSRRPPLPEGRARQSSVGASLLADNDFRFLVSVVAPGLVWQYDLTQEGKPEAARVWAPDGSIASLAADGSVREAGPRRLWALIEDAHDVFVDADSPGPGRYGVSVTGPEQRVWLDEPGGHGWGLIGSGTVPPPPAACGRPAAARDPRHGWG
ncbi:methyltransferase domain-containing protein [Streptomyces sp. R302]|uniref:methyltransferase domain-containing protein n=1 Tax=unclassified Streptomyces TaxID=2593676 RepID=UPI00145E587B|nr:MULTISPECIES: methyltransferase domain-containing protein [unclassified Streptomyces]NML53353.1 methyltransferase domain-containing protein [Streptomyces sp. R301]NML78307.1 methyltransferase domain-containing protein [Streptomyces sp. R302]